MVVKRMKIALALMCLILSISTFSQSSSVEKTKVCGLEVKDTEPKTYTWVLAIKVCETYGEGWHLPTKDELNCLFKNKDTIGGFSNTYYWSSSEYKNDSYFTWYQDFSSGSQNAFDLTNKLSVRCVKVSP